MRKLKIVLCATDGDYDDYITLERECKVYRYNGNFLEVSPTGGFSPLDKVLMIPLENILYMEEM